ncbi:LuxR family transcriptional regulator [Pseudonocardia spinosispora]|uniref:LuxR family transcriptional regulator n=1 Tax=Pseudonocardia spinosispora TaxID=103441 RepID=UPI0004134C2A|nr:LuxR family transcriptional regulator [Pseudonocardia spinosispora]
MSVCRLVPDLGGQLCGVLRQVEEVLLTLEVWERNPDEPATLPAPLADREALRALHRVQDAIRPTQTYTDDLGERHSPHSGVGNGRLLGPGGDYEHRPLRLVQLRASDLAVLNSAAIALGMSLALEPGSELTEAIVAGAEAAYSSTTGDLDVVPVAVVELLARVLGVLDLDVTDDTRLLAARLEAAAGADVVLDRAEEAAYYRLAERINMMWADGHPADRHR